ncbi:MAG: alginate export family protein, partial [Bryobacteraceae bacterium]
NTFLRAVPKATVDMYILRRDQNRPGGFTLPGTLAINTFGGNVVGSLPGGFRYKTEEVFQTGHNSAKEHRGFGAFGDIGKTFGKLSVSVEYIYASGDNGKNSGRETTFDQLYAANHDKFGHADLFGWRNMQDFRSLLTMPVNKHVTANFMYDNWWLASATDFLYDGAGRGIIRSANGTAGRHVGQEFDVFGTFQFVKGLLFGTGVAKLVPGEFLNKTTPNPHTLYFYVFQSYSF